MIRTDRLYVDNGSYVYAWSDKQQRIERISTPSVNDPRNYTTAASAASCANKPFQGNGAGAAASNVEALVMEMEENDIQQQQAKT